MEIYFKFMVAILLKSSIKRRGRTKNIAVN